MVSDDEGTPVGHPPADSRPALPEVADRLFPRVPDEQLALRPRPRLHPAPSDAATADPSSDLDPEGLVARDGGGGDSFVREVPVLLLIALVLAFLLRTFVVQVFFIPSGSMEPTLAVDDRIAVEKLTYRLREPRRGDVVVFEGEELPDEDIGLATRVGRGIGQFLGVVPANARDYVKRVIGLPGDTVELRGGTVLVNGIPLDEPYVVFEDASDYGPVSVPDGMLFFLGDNRPNSADSRSALGMVPRVQVVGRAAFVIWPFAHGGSLAGVDHTATVEGP